MAINKTSGDTLSFKDDIEKEFGNNPSRSLGSYRSTHPDFQNENPGDLSNLPLDTGIPTSGEIKFSDFYGKKLNIVVDCFSSGNDNFNHDCYTNRFANGNYVIVGKYKSTISKSQWDGGKKVIIHINKQFKSTNASDRDHVALKQGTISDTATNAWPTSTTFQIDVGSSGLVGGKGGNGGDSGNEETPGQNGGTGTSGMKIHSGTPISGESRIFGGGGGGGSGSGAEQNDWGDKNSAAGGRGGGGAGLPGGEGGNENANEDGTANAGGDGINGANNAEAVGGNGGDGGGRNLPGADASGGASTEHLNGEGGTAGFQYRFY